MTGSSTQDSKEFRRFKARRNISADVFAAFTINQIDPTILEGMTQEQVQAIRDALIAQRRDQQHSLDLRLSIPLYFRRYYLVIVGGRDKRLGTLITERARQQSGVRFMGMSAMSVVLMVATALLLIGAFLTAYWVKSEMGIDIFPDRHLKDVVNDLVN